MGAHILAIKDMAGLCKPYAAELLVKTLEAGDRHPDPLPHARHRRACRRRRSSRRPKSDSTSPMPRWRRMSGGTSQPNLNTLVEALRFTDRDTGLPAEHLDAIAEYWRAVREFYTPFESPVLPAGADLYQHEMPGGQYTNLYQQARALGLADRWREVCRVYADVNQLLGDIVKVTPTSKAVGDMALFLIANDMSADDVLAGTRELAFPQSVIDLVSGRMGQPPGGFPRKVRERILRGEKPLRGRPGAACPPPTSSRRPKRSARCWIANHRAAKSSRICSTQRSSPISPEHQQQYADTSILPTPAFLYGTGPGDKTGVAVNLSALSDNGGQTWTHLPVAGSPVIDAAATACPALDQRGYARPAGAACDAGAVESGAAEPAVPAAGTLPPLDKPIAVNYQWPGFVHNLQVIRYPLGVLPSPAVPDPLLAGKHRIDVTVCLYRTDMAGDTNTKRDPYERIMEAFADGLYEMSNGVHVLRYVTFVYGCEPGVIKDTSGKVDTLASDTDGSYTADIIWIRSVWPTAAISGYGGPGRHLYMADALLNFTPTLNALGPSGSELAGYTLAHEWGHYMYGMQDEYLDPATPCDSKDKYQRPCAGDTPVTPSIMSCPLRVFLTQTCGDWSTKVSDGYNWLNFSSPPSGNKNNSHYRLYKADAWTVLSRPLSADPPEIYKKSIAPLRFYFQELRAVAPAKGELPRIDLVLDPSKPGYEISRRALQFIWRRQGERQGGGGGLPTLEPDISPLHRCLACPENLFVRNEFIYPSPVEFRLGLQRDLPVNNMQVSALVKAPDGSQFQAPVTGDGVGGYVAQLPYTMGGQYQVNFAFTNPNLQAKFTNAGLHYAPAADGSAPPVVETPVGVPFTITVSTTYTVTGFQADDHADTPASATPLAADYEPILGRIDRSDDVDVFATTVPADGTLVVRVVDLTPGMRPRLIVRNPNGAVLFDGTYDIQGAQPYLFTRLALAPGAAVFIAVADAAGMQGASYQVSAGAALAATAEQGVTLYLPTIAR